MSDPSSDSIVRYIPVEFDHFIYVLAFSLSFSLPCKLQPTSGFDVSGTRQKYDCSPKR